MSETSRSVTRAVALAVLIAVFAGAWHNDRPADSSVASHLPPDQRTFLLASARPRPSQRPVDARPYPAAAAGVGKVASPVEALAQNVPLRQAASERSRSISLEPEGLMISQEELSRHLARLPLTIAAGNYRIVDRFGGVGWLRISETHSFWDGEAEPLLSTVVDGQTVRYIRVERSPTAMASQREENWR